jgi:TPR repeat protein
LYNLGLDYSKGMRGMPYDRDKAVKCYEEAVELGSPKAAINLGILLRKTYVMERNEQEMLKLMNRYFQKAIDMGCPDAYYYVSYSYQEGWGALQNKWKSRDLMWKGVEEGSFACMAGWGMILEFDGKTEEARVWLQRSLDGGYGPAAHPLCMIYFQAGDVERQVQVLRQGARLGDKMSLAGLSVMYEGGEIQPKDLEYAACFDNITAGIDSRLAPPMIDDLDERCPPRPIVPYTRPIEK